ncbi:mitotic-spindle organizing protein 1-like [Schistocerca piceifrons]|uniref:mitotic-spindle organizing protein 1-like n=1 Tax=Schistocerca piceifrons TaxID=274613 RepID=UPI001F5E60B9|nr:mitotic-spindle organizing protein 1-like [Schistocerca piceifrons]
MGKKKKKMAGKGNPNLEKVLEAQYLIKKMHEVSQLMGVDLDPKTLVLSMRLMEHGANPAALAKLIKDIKRIVSILEETDKQDKGRENK